MDLLGVKPGERGSKNYFLTAVVKTAA